MKLFLASMNPAVLRTFFELFHIKLNVLISFLDQNRSVLRFMLGHLEMIDTLILDSGAWTLNNTKSGIKQLTVPKSLKFYLEDFGDKFDFYFNYDSDFSEGGFEQNYSNQLELENAGLSPVPVVHDYYGRTEIDTYIEKGYKRVALGSIEGRTVADIHHATQRLKKAGVYVHLFRCASFKALSSLPVDSADASSWAHDTATGCIRIWNPDKNGENKTQIFRMQDFLTQKNSSIKYLDTYEHREGILELIYKSTGITYNNLMGLDAHLYRAVLNCFYYSQLQHIISEKQHTKN